MEVSASISQVDTLQHAETQCHTLLLTATHCCTQPHNFTHCDTLPLLNNGNVWACMYVCVYCDYICIYIHTYIYINIYVCVCGLTRIYVGLTLTLTLVTCTPRRFVVDCEIPQALTLTPKRRFPNWTTISADCGAVEKNAFLSFGYHNTT